MVHSSCALGRTHIQATLAILAAFIIIALLMARVYQSIDPDPRECSKWRDPNPGVTSSTGLSSLERTRLVHSLYLSKARAWGAWVHGSLYYRAADIDPLAEVETILRDKDDRLLYAAVADAAANHDFESVRSICKRLAERYRPR